LLIIPASEGHVIGRIVEHDGPGPWWEYVEIVRTLKAAKRRARELARGCHVWLWSGPNRRFQE